MSEPANAGKGDSLDVSLKKKQLGEKMESQHLALHKSETLLYPCHQRSLVYTSGVTVQSAVPVDREEFHLPHFAFVLSLFVVRGEERQRGTPEVVHCGESQKGE